MPRALVVEPIRIKNKSGAHRTIGPRYYSEGKKKFKVCPQVEISAREFAIFKECNNVRAAIGKADEVRFSGDGHPRNWVPVAEPDAAADPGGDSGEGEGEGEKSGKPPKDRNAKTDQVKTK